MAALFYGNRYIICNLGDSRAYRLGNGIELITKDHSYVQRELDAGRMTEAEAEVSPQRSVILQCIGASDDIFPDFSRVQPVPATVLYSVLMGSGTK